MTRRTEDDLMPPSHLPTKTQQTLSLAPSQQARLTRFNARRCVDVHCHVLAGVDDGPRNMTDAIALCRMLVEDGITDVIATPHQLGRFDGANHGPAVRAAVSTLQSHLDESAIPLCVHSGGEVRLDERIPKLLTDDKILTLADARSYLLLELPPGMVVDPKFL